MIDAYSSQPHYADHLQPVWDALPEQGSWYAPRAEWTRAGGYTTAIPTELGLTLVAGHADAVVVARRGGTPILLEHGAGQSYTGHDGYRHPSNPGGDLREQVGLFLCTNEQTAAANLARYPSIPAAVVGSPRLDVLAELRAQRDPADDPVFGLAWHWNCLICPESRWALPEWGPAMLELDWPGELVGTCHPRGWQAAARWYERAGIRAEPSWGELVGQLDVLSCDNSSVMFEAAALGIPVVVVNSARYRAEAEHGLRFWEHADIGPQLWPQPDPLLAANDWSLAAEEAIADAHLWAGRVEAMAAAVYPHRGRAAQLAAAAVVEFADG